MRFHIISIFPNILEPYLDESILKRAKKNGLADYRLHDLRDWTTDRHRSVDDAPYGGGAGMLMKIQPLHRALEAIGRSNAKTPAARKKVVLLSASGKKWTQALAKKYSKLDELILICGRYEGVDARIRKFVDAEISVGDYVLTGGELPALILVDSITRLLPGALGNRESIVEESHAASGLLEYPQYTRPEVFEANGKKYRVPKVLLSGDHKKIQAWRQKMQKKAR